MAPSPDTFRLALRQNKDWASTTAHHHPTLFPTLAKSQSPEILWIGCSDSRVPETTVLGLKPGDVFVLRNIANILSPGDISSEAVIEFAVKHLKVKHIVLCGHTLCGGVAAALGNKKLGVIDTWLVPLMQLRKENERELERLEGEEERGKRLVELNVLRGVRVLRENEAVGRGLREEGLEVHGLVYDVASGVLEELDTYESEADAKTRREALGTE